MQEPSSIITIGRKHGFKLHTGKLEEVVLDVYNAAEKRIGIFSDGLKPFLPQWNIPDELEYSPQEKHTKDPREAAKFLWLRTFCDRLSRSRYLTHITRQAWSDPKARWLFNPDELASKSPLEISTALKEKIKFAVTAPSEEDNGERIRYNSEILVAKYSGNPINTIAGKTIEQARKELMEFKGIGTGLANLYIMQMLDRNIAPMEDPENALLKVDRHKAAIPIYTGAIEPLNHEIDHNLLVEPLEIAYREIATKNGLDFQTLDAALWILGSEVCSQKNFGQCATNCSLSREQCVSRVPLVPETGRYAITINGKRAETRRDAGQGHLFYAADLLTET